MPVHMELRRIIISEKTYQHLLRDDPELAKTCVIQPPVKVKGIVAEVKIYEVPWRPTATGKWPMTNEQCPVNDPVNDQCPMTNAQ